MNPENLDLKKLKAFELVAKEGNLRTAAQRLKLTTSAISFCIRRLEEDLGVELFTRFPNKLVLTAAGEHLLAETENILGAVERAISSIPSDKAPNGISIAVCNSALVSYITPRISNFMTRFPNTKMALLIYTSSEALALVDAGKIDVCLGRFADIPSNLDCKLIVESSLSLACPRSHPVIEGKLTLQRMTEYPLITLHRRTMTRVRIEKAFSDSNLHVDRFVEVRTCQAALAAAARDAGIAIIHSLCTGSAPDERLCFADLGNLFQKISFHAVYRKQEKSRAIYEVLDALTSDELQWPQKALAGRPSRKKA
jgi:DNA-binding transcriptional LysR family regulator